MNGTENSKIVARKSEIAILDNLYRSQKAEFLAIYGRRRVGKTFLISEYFKNKGFYFELTGMLKAKKSEQLKNFAIEFADKFNYGVLGPIPNSWQDAFTQLRYEIEAHNQPEQKIILFFDELPWLASKKSGFLPALEHFWNRYLSRYENVILIVCGSAASWMIKKIINNKGGLYGRLTAEIYLQPLKLAETEIFLEANHIHLDRKQIVELYMAFGGIPKYLSNIRNGKSAAQTIQEHCFSPTGSLVREFPKLLLSLFEKPEKHIKIIEFLATKYFGATKAELLAAVGLSYGGAFSQILLELEQSGFIVFTPSFSKKKKEGSYKLSDEYCLFYLTWIKPAIDKHAINLAKNYWLKMQSTPAYRAWSGYAFESICEKHFDKIISALRLDVVAISATSWRYVPPKGSSDQGAQIDLVIDRSDRCITLCEIKFSNDMYVIDKVYLQKLQQKVNCFRKVTQTKKTLFFAMVTVYGVSENSHYHAIINDQVTLEDLF